MTETEWRVVCAHQGTPGHTDHAWVKGNEKKARQAVIDSNHRAEMKPKSFYADEAPYQVESREVGPWEVSE